MGDLKDKNGNIINVGDFIKIFDFKVEIEYFTTTNGGNNVMVGTDYGEININLVEKYIDNV